MPESFRLDILGRANDAFERALDRLSDAERIRCLSTLGQILRRLKVDAFSFGEELYDLKALGMQVRLGVLLPIAVQFGGDFKNRLVVVQHLFVMESATLR